MDFICRRPHFKRDTEAAVSIFNIYTHVCTCVLILIGSDRYGEYKNILREYRTFRSSINLQNANTADFVIGLDNATCKFMIVFIM